VFCIGCGSVGFMTSPIPYDPEAVSQYKPRDSRILLHDLRLFIGLRPKMQDSDRMV